MKEAILIEQTMQHASVYLLFLLHIGLFELLHGVDQLKDFLIYLGSVCREHFLEVLVCCIVDLLGVLNLRDLAREEFTYLGYYLSYLVKSLFLDLGITSILLITQMFNGNAQFLSA